MKKYALKFTNHLREVFYFSGHGETWPNNPERKLIQTSPNFRDAVRFKEESEAITALAVSGMALAGTEQVGWEIIDTAAASVSDGKP